MKKMKHLLLNLFRHSNIGTIIFFLLNIGMILLPFIASDVDMETIVYVVVAYLLSIAFAFSTAGQKILCFFTGARKMTRIDDRNRILPLSEEVFLKAKEKTPDMPDRINIRIMTDANPNAFAIGLNTICVTTGLMKLPEYLIQGVLAHEIGHIALQHTVIQVLIGGGNYIMMSFFIVNDILTAILSGIAVIAGKKGSMKGCLTALFTIWCAGIIFLWTKFCMLLLCGSSRANEYEADKYAFELGYGNELAEMLDSIDLEEPSSSFLKILTNTHPHTDDRIGKLQSYGVSYSKY